ncbi:hypothetical protein PP357_gp42 [Arthrobacter phage Sarge]|uniref:Uncharacterized protein n=1 Tax=Arthrobacter phage Sarge TaxID=2885974 RepID=A0AAE9C1Z8_9CAUD|nr:hypothetical protein PP357_gp42 [Arthrobacter phage Sarge]UDL14889.1 hypothetical protein SEA_SARGE_42 [Arthrobacter phage Sarge]
MSARDELAEVIKAVDIIREKGETRPHALRQADAVLAAGYRKPRTITTQEELDALPEGVMVWTDAGFYLKERLMHGISTWVTTNERWYFKTEDIPLPATVLHEPEASK